MTLPKELEKQGPVENLASLCPKDFLGYVQGIEKQLGYAQGTRETEFVG